MRHLSPIVAALLAAACSARPAPPPRALPPAEPPLIDASVDAPDVVDPPDATDVVDAPTIVATAAGDLDGDGEPEEVRLSSDGTLRVYRRGREVVGSSGQSAGVLGEALGGPGQSSLAVVDIDRRDRQRELMVTTADGDEDPPRHYRFFVYRDGRLWNMLRRCCDDGGFVAAPSGVAARVPGDGSVVIDYEWCVRDADPDRHARGITERVTHRLALADGWMRRGDLRETQESTRRPSDCIQAACPVVRVGAAGRRAGEILRDLRAPGDEAWQSLRLDPADVDPDGTLRVTLREEKRETSFVDAVALVADGRAVAPEGCADGDAPWCRADGRRAALAPGQSIALRFRAPGAASLTLRARGFYVTFPADEAAAPSPPNLRSAP